MSDLKKELRIFEVLTKVYFTKDGETYGVYTIPEETLLKTGLTGREFALTEGRGFLERCQTFQPLSAEMKEAINENS